MLHNSNKLDEKSYNGWKICTNSGSYTRHRNWCYYYIFNHPPITRAMTRTHYLQSSRLRRQDVKRRLMQGHHMSLVRERLIFNRPTLRVVSTTTYVKLFHAVYLFQPHVISFVPHVSFIVCSWQTWMALLLSAHCSPFPLALLFGATPPHSYYLRHFNPVGNCMYIHHIYLVT